MSTISYSWSKNTRCVSLWDVALEVRYAHVGRHHKRDGRISRVFDSGVRGIARTAYRIAGKLGGISKSLGIAGRRGEFGIDSFFAD